MTTLFTATLLRASPNGFAALAASRLAERADGERVEGDFEAWQAHMRTLLLELAAAVESGDPEPFAAKVVWTRDAFLARGLEATPLRTGLDELAKVLEESLPAEAWKSLPSFFDVARRELEHEPKAGHGPETGGPLNATVGAYVAHLEGGDAAKAIEAVVGAVREGRLSIPDAIDGVLTRALREIGRLWHAAAINVAEEHFASQTTGRLLEQLLLLAPRPEPNGRTVVLTMVEGDAHELGLRIVAAFFELDGWRTICLGSNTPTHDLVQAVERFGADLVVLGATLNTQRQAVQRTIERLKESRPDRKILVGGSAFCGREGLAREVGADLFAPGPREAVRMADELLDME